MFCGTLCTICTAPVGAPSILRQGWVGGGRVAPQEEAAAGLQVDEGWVLSAGAPELAAILPGDAECDSPDPSGHH